LCPKNLRSRFYLSKPRIFRNFCSSTDSKTIFRTVYSQSCDTSSNSCYSDEPRDETVETCSGTDVCENAECRAFDCNIDGCPQDGSQCRTDGVCIGGEENPCETYDDCPYKESQDCQSGTCVDLPPGVVRCESGFLGLGKTCAQDGYKCDTSTDIVFLKFVDRLSMSGYRYSENYCSQDGKSVLRTAYTFPCDTASNSCSTGDNEETVETCTGSDMCISGECTPYDCNYAGCPNDGSFCNPNTGQCIGGEENPCTNYKDCPYPESQDCQSGNV